MKAHPEFGDPCPHCGEPQDQTDMFGIPWCYEIYWGVKKPRPKEEDES